MVFGQILNWQWVIPKLLPEDHNKGEMRRWIRQDAPEIELVLEVRPGSPLSLNEHHDAEVGGATGKIEVQNGKVEDGQFITFRFSQAFGPMVRPEPLGSEESREACKGHSSGWQKASSLRKGQYPKNTRRLCQTFYRTACLSEGGRHGSRSVRGGGSGLCRGRARGFCTFCVPVRCWRVVPVPVEQN